MLQDLMNSWEGLSASRWLLKLFPWKVVEMLEEMVVSRQEVRWISYLYTQISQSFTSSRCRNPQHALLIHSAWRCPLHSYSCFILHYGFWLSLSFKTAKPPTESRTWVKLLDLSGTPLWDHLLCLPSTAGPDCPASKRNTVNRGNPAPQWTMVESPGAPLCLHLALPRADCTRRSLPGSGVSLAQKAQSAGNLELKVSSSLRTLKENREV